MLCAKRKIIIFATCWLHWKYSYSQTWWSIPPGSALMTLLFWGWNLLVCFNKAGIIHSCFNCSDPKSISAWLSTNSLYHLLSVFKHFHMNLLTYETNKTDRNTPITAHWHDLLNLCKFTLNEYMKMLLENFDLSCLFHTVCQNMIVETCKHWKRLQKLGVFFWKWWQQ